MSSEGTFSARGDRDFGLIETFRWSRTGGYALLPEHLARLAGSTQALGFACNLEEVERRLHAFARDAVDATSRVRLVLARDGVVTISESSLGPPAAAYRVALAGARHPSGDPWLRHKTTMRDRYEQPLADAAASSGADEVLFLNERGELCEGARSNLFVRSSGRLLTPPLSCGLLPGTLRARLLQGGEAEEAVLSLDDLATAEMWFMGNSVRGLVPAILMRTPVEVLRQGRSMPLPVARSRPA